MPVLLLNDYVRRFHASAPAAVTGFHRRLPGYRPTPLHRAPKLATRLGVGSVYVKDESARLGLPAFKILGASWAVYRLGCRLLGIEPVWDTFEELAGVFRSLRPLTLVTATDGNHGRAVARVAQWFGFDARIFVPAGTAPARIAAIESEGATVTVVEGDYDQAVAEAAALADRRTLVVSDMSWPGYEEIPRDIIDGYATLFREVDAQLVGSGQRPPDLVMVQAGVGALAAAAVMHFRAGTARIVAVEAEGADCVLRSLEQGRIVSVAGPHRSIMAGLNCGTPSRVAWPYLRDGLDAVISVDNAGAGEAVRLMRSAGMISGETGAPGLAGLVGLASDPHAFADLGIGATSSVLVLSTEGITDPAMYRHLAGGEAGVVHRERGIRAQHTG